MGGGSGPVQGQQAYTTAGTFSFVVPAGVTSISAVVVGVAAAALMRTGLEAGINQQEVAEALPIKTA